MNVNPTGRLLIRRFESQYLIPRDHPAPLRIQGALDEAAAGPLAQALVRALTPWFSSTDSSFWLIRQLEVELDIDADCAQEQLARAWMAQIVRSVAATIQGGSDGENVLWFPSRAAYVARFLADVADGRAWSKWYYESFQGLKPLPASAILRTAVCESPSMGEVALRELSKSELKKVLRTLSAADARFVLDRLAGETTDSGEEFRALEAAWSVLGSPAWEPFDFGGEWQDALGLYLAASQNAGGGIALKTAVLALLGLATLLMEGSGTPTKAWVEVLAKGEMAPLYAMGGPANAERLSPLLRCPSGWAKEVSFSLMARVTGSPSGRTEKPAALQFTPFGGVFLLLPILDEWPLAKAAQGWPDAEKISPSTILRLLILAKCFGQPRAQRVFQDDLIRDLLGIPPDFSIETLGRWQKDISAGHCETFLSILADWLSQRSIICGDKLILCLATDVAVLLDGARGIWLAAEEFSPPCPKGLQKALRTWMEQVPPEKKSMEASKPAPLLLCDPEIFIQAASSFPEARVLRVDDERVQPIAEEDSVLTEILARLGRLPDDLAHLSLPKSWGLMPEFDHMLSVAAQNLMRSFAWRLPGFAHSNLPYLYGNFLDFSASLEDEPDRRVVRVGRPPLHLILSMTGIARGTYRLGWLDGRPFALFPEG